MHVFIITQYFPPEIGAASSRWGDFTKILTKKNHKVTVLCESPHYPKSIYYKGYKNQWTKREKISKNLTIIRSKAYASKRDSFIKKIIHYLVFATSAILNFKKVKNYDLIIISSPPLFTGIIGLFYSKFYNKEYWLDIRDLWPDSALELDQIKKGFLYKFGKKLELAIYNSAKGFIFPVPGFRSYLDSLSDKISKKPKFELMNGVSNDFIKKSKSIQSIRKSFTVLYSGNMGLAQDLHTIIQAAGILKDYNINFNFVGDGVCKKEIKELAKPLLDKVFFYDSIERDKVVQVIKNASICLVPLKDKKIFENALPSKMFEYMACERPIIVGIRGEAKKLVNDARAGIAIEPEDAKALSKAILSYYNNEDKCTRHGQNGLTFVTKKLLKEVLISKIIYKLKNE